MATTLARLQIFGSLSRRMQEDRNLFNQDFRAAPAWSIRSGQIESGPGAFPDCSSWRALTNSSGVKSSETFLSVGVGILQSSDTSLDMSLADSRSFVLYFPFSTNCEAMELAEMGQTRRGCLDLPVCYRSVVSSESNVAVLPLWKTKEK